MEDKIIVVPERLQQSTQQSRFTRSDIAQDDAQAPPKPNSDLETFQR